MLKTYSAHLRYRTNFHSFSVLLGSRKSLLKMSAENATGYTTDKPGEKAERADRWSDLEKLALLTSIVAAAGPFKWDDVNLPEGRTKKACMHVYAKALETVKTIPMNSGKEPAIPKKRASKKAPAVANTKGTAKGKRTRAQATQAAAEGVLSDASTDDGGLMAKKLKGEPTSNDEIKGVVKGDVKGEVKGEVKEV
ncbi:MAG: hypothetical protein Q9212_005322 [Teloschistes hypoglaucus]